MRSVLFDGELFMLEKLIKPVVQIMAFVICLMVINPAQAHRNWHNRWGWGVSAGFIGGAVMAPQFPRPYYYQAFPPPVIYQQPIVVYEQPRVTAVAPMPVAPVVVKPASWYFCESENNFYPNVSSCAEPWKLIQTEPSSTYMPSLPPSVVSN